MVDYSGNNWLLVYDLVAKKAINSSLTTAIEGIDIHNIYPVSSSSGFAYWQRRYDDDIFRWNLVLKTNVRTLTYRIPIKGIDAVGKLKLYPGLDKVCFELGDI